MKSGKLGIIIQVVFTSLSFSQTYIPPGDISGTWLLNDSPFYIQGDITIPNDSTLIIEPGVIVEFQGHFALSVQGRLLAIGTDTNNITFTISDTTGFHNPDTSLGGWNGIQFIDTPTENDTSKIIYCTMQFGKAVGSSPPDNSGGAIFISNFSKVLISNSSITYNSAGGTDSPTGGGISLHFADVNLTENEISHNHAFDGGGIQIWECDPVFDNNSILFNNAGQAGGGIWIGGVSNVNFNNDIISNNIAEGNGGGIIAWQTTNTIFNSVNIINNIGHDGGGAAFYNCAVQFNSCDISDNASAWIGGGINAFSSDIEINNTSFERDTAFIFGGAMGVYYSELSITNSNLIDNSARILGGGIHSDYTNINIRNTIFERDTSGDVGGGIFTWQSNLNLEGCNFINNSATNNGGAVSSSNCNLLVDSCLFSLNSAGSEAGAIECFIDTSYFTEKLSIQINNSEFLNNSSGNLFAGVKIRQNNSDTALCSVRMDKNLFKGNTANAYSAIRFIGNIDDIVVNNSIFEENSANQFTSIFSANGGAKVKVNNCVFTKNYPRAVSLNINARLDFMNCTFANNYGTNSSALSLRNNAEATLTNSILWNNGNNPILLVNVGTNGNILTVNYSDIQFGPDSLIIPDSLSILNWGVGNIDSEPLFVDTLNNDFHIQDFSPCIAAGIDSIEIAGFWYYSPSIDIEGNPRPNPPGTMPDMGAYESQFPSRVGEQNSKLPAEFSLSQNYPNPFNPSTKIRFTVPRDVRGERQEISLIVYDVLGNEVALLVNEELSAGKYEVEFNTVSSIVNPASGIYFYQLKAGSYIKTRKMLLIK